MKSFRVFLTLIIVSFSFALQAQNENKDSLQFSLEIVVNDIRTDDPLVGTDVKIIGTDGSSRKFNPNKNGVIPFIKLNKNTSYSIVVEKTKYLIGKGIVTTVGLNKKEHFVHKYSLQPFIICVTRLYKQYFNENENISFKADVEEGSPNKQIPYEYYYDLLVENPTLVMQIVGYQNRSEKENISKERAKNYMDKLINLGIAKERLIFVDGGIRNYREFPTYKKEKNNEKWNQENRIVTFQIIRDDFPIKN